LQLQNDETITAILDATKNTGENLFFCTKNGVVKKTTTDAFSNVRRSGLIAVGLRDNDELKWVKMCSAENQIMIVTRNGKSIRFDEKDIRSMGRSAAGVRGIRLKDDDECVEMDIIKNLEESNLLVVMENGLGKMSKTTDFREQTRGGSGVKCANITKKTGKVVGAKILENGVSTDLIFAAKSGQTIRMSADEIPSRGRATQGVILMRLSGDDAVSGVSKIQIPDEKLAEKNDEKSENLKLI
jgi:DNA gyrase subunit A